MWELSDKSKSNVLIVFSTIITGFVMTGGVITKMYQVHEYLSTMGGQIHLAITMMLWMLVAIGIGKKAEQIDGECDCDSCSGITEREQPWIV